MKSRIPAPLLRGLGDVVDPYLPDTTPVPPHVRRAVLFALRYATPELYLSAAYLARAPLALNETLTGDFTCACPLPSHPLNPADSPYYVAPTPHRPRAGRVARALQQTPPAAALLRRRPFRFAQGDLGSGWRCSACGSGSAIQFLTRLFHLPVHSGEAAAWNLAARLFGLVPSKVPARSWLPWDVSQAHLEWGTALAYTRANLDSLRPLYQALYPSWSDSDILQFPATGRGTYLVCYRVRGRMTQLEEVDLPSAEEGGARPLRRRVRYHHWLPDSPTRLARSVTGVFPDTLRENSPGPGAGAGGPLERVAHLVRGAEEATSARHLLGARVVGTAYGPVGLSQSDLDALASYDRVLIWAAHEPSGRGFQNQMVRLLRACGIAAEASRWPDADSLPRGYDLEQLLQDGGTLRTSASGRPELLIPAHSHRQLQLPLAETA